MTTSIVRQEGNWIISEDTNYQGFRYNTESLHCVPTNHRARRKWAAVESVFSELVYNRSFMDIGANHGFFCFKALEHHTSLSIGIEPNSEYYQSVTNILPVHSLDWRRMSWPFRNLQADVVMFLSMLHHFCPGKMLMEDVFRALYYNAHDCVICEWVGLDDIWMADKNINTNEYNHDVFLLTANSLFESVIELGPGHHNTRKIYLLEK